VTKGRRAPRAIAVAFLALAGCGAGTRASSGPHAETNAPDAPPQNSSQDGARSRLWDTHAAAAPNDAAPRDPATLAASPLEGGHQRDLTPVNEGESLEEARLRARVEQALRASPGLHGDPVRVQVEGHAVALAGFLGSPAALDIARDVALAIPGVDRVSIAALRVRARG
jgi:hypothetical protein